MDDVNLRTYSTSTSRFEQPTEDSRLNEVNLTGTAAQIHTKRRKVPQRILHFSDGTLEEYSSDEDEPDGTDVKAVIQVDPKLLNWGPWMLYQASLAGSRTVQVCDYVGEYLADFFGITTPKYQYEIEEYHRIVAEEKENQRKLDLEMGGWSSSSDLKLSPLNEQPGVQQRY